MPHTHGGGLGRIAAAAVLFAALAHACDGTTTDTVAPDAGTPGDDGSASKGDCPTDPPSPGAGCALPEGTTCDFGACGSRLAVCTGAHWHYGANPAPDPPCPADPPAVDAACPACWPSGKTCTYFAESCLSGDAASPQNVAVAACVAGGATGAQWSVAIRPCSPDDAGADVQGDGADDGASAD